MNSSPNLRLTVGAAVAAIVAGVAMSSYSPVARTAEAEDELVEVVVTGSRILRRDTESNSPLVTVDAAQLESRSGLNIESYLNQLPAYNPAAVPTAEGTNSDVQITSINSVGIASVSLRGFGANRSLVLVDGRRAVPTNALMVVDLNSIPSSMLRGAEIISGGASATYGADAMGGVSNMQLRRTFQGLETDLQWGITEVSDNEELRASVIAGTKFSEGKGSMVFAAEYYDRKGAFDKNRRFYTDSYKDRTVGGNFLGFVQGTNGFSSSTYGGPNINAVRAIVGAGPTGAVCAFGTTTNCNNTSFRFNDNGSIWLPGNSAFNAPSWGGGFDDFRYSRVTAYNGALCTAANPATCPAGPQLTELLKYSETEGYTSSPQTRYSFMGVADYDITDKLQFKSSARFATSTTETFLGGNTSIFGWEVSVPYEATFDSPVDPTLDYTNPTVLQQVLANPAGFRNPTFIPHGAANARHPVPVNLAVLLNSRAASVPGQVYCLFNQPGCTTANATRDVNLVGLARTGRAAPWIMEALPLDSFGRRATENVNEAWQVEAGLTYDLPIKDWTAEVYYSRGESSTYNVAFGNNSLARWRALITAPDYGRGAALRSNLTNNPGANPGFGSIDVPCTTGFYETIFQGDAVPSADCQYAARAALQTRTQNQQDIFELNFQGGLFNLPAGELRAAWGYQQRRNASQYNPDILQSTASFTDQVIGVYPNGYLRKHSIAKDIWAEALVPVLADLPFLKKFELEIGGRHSSYSTTDSTNTYKINANIQINDWMRFRGGYNKATRAPNLGELFLPLQQLFTGSGVYTDPCSLRSNAPFGAGGAAPDLNNSTPFQPVGGQTPEGRQSAYLICRAMMDLSNAGGSNFFYNTPTTVQPTAPGSAFNNQIGNPDLKSEKADTYTAGVVLRSPFEHALLNRIQMTIDWYKIDINDAILLYNADYANFRCFGAVQVTSPTQAQAQALSAACLNVPRNQATGGALSTRLSYDNQAWVKTSGIDFTVNWSADLADMGLTSIPGALNLGVNGTWLKSYKTKTSPASYDPAVEWKGTLGPALTSFNGGAYDYRLFTNIGYSLPSFGLNLRWRHLPEVEPAGKATIRANIANNKAVAAGAPGLLLNYTPSVAYNVAQFDQFDLSGYWNINDMLSVRFGVDNLLDTQPSSTTRSAGRPYDYSSGQTAATNAARLAATCNNAPAPQCTNPFGYALPNSGLGSTNGGFYDVLGRRYFVALKARF
jgi:iron complex outermembrane receptor protein